MHADLTTNTVLPQLKTQLKIIQIYMYIQKQQHQQQQQTNKQVLLTTTRLVVVTGAVVLTIADHVCRNASLVVFTQIIPLSALTTCA